MTLVLWDDFQRSDRALNHDVPPIGPAYDQQGPAAPWIVSDAFVPDPGATPVEPSNSTLLSTLSLVPLVVSVDFEMLDTGSAREQNVVCGACGGHLVTPGSVQLALYPVPFSTSPSFTWELFTVVPGSPDPVYRTLSLGTIADLVFGSRYNVTIGFNPAESSVTFQLPDGSLVWVKDPQIALLWSTTAFVQIRTPHLIDGAVRVLMFSADSSPFRSSLMSGKSTYSDATVNAGADGIGALYNSGKLIIYDGPTPADANTALGGSNHVLATHTLNATAFGAAVAGLITANAIAAVTITRSGVANFFRVFQSDGVSKPIQGSIGNQAVTLTAQIGAVDTTMTVSPLSLPLYAGQEIWFNDNGTLKKIAIAADAAAAATSVTITAPGFTVSNGSVAGAGCAVVNSPNYQLNAQSGISSLTVQVSESGT